MKNSNGKLVVPNGCFPEPHELETVATLIALGKDVTFIEPMRVAGQKSPDIEMDGIRWEMKTLLGNSKTTAFNAVKRGAKQSKYLIIDLRKTKMADSLAMKDIKTSMAKTASIKRVFVIDKQSSVIALP